MGYLMMLIPNGICQYGGRYAALNKNICHFLGPSPSVFSGKKSKAREHIQIDAMLRSGFFRKTRSVTVPRFGFFRIHGFISKNLHFSQKLGTLCRTVICANNQLSSVCIMQFAVLLVSIGRSACHRNSNRKF